MGVYLKNKFRIYALSSRHIASKWNVLASDRRSCFSLNV
ncbi:hypothetical protein FB99_25460 [Pantoea agglomerans]|nr:hypothetical protein FB99_25460 [Pantoea agglomerans]